jgi:hypothetical protein
MTQRGRRHRGERWEEQRTEGGEEKKRDEVGEKKSFIEFTRAAFPHEAVAMRVE